MEHLSARTLARLVDDTPTEQEARHLEACLPCRTGLDAFREQTEALGGLPDLRPPPGDWEVLQARMVSEGLVKARSRAGLERLAVTPGWMKAAAAVLLFLGGAGTGFAGAHQLPDRAGGPLASMAARPPSATGLTPAAGSTGSPGGRGVVAVSSLDEAARTVRQAEQSYIDALVRYRQLAEAESGEAGFGDPAGRYAALEYLVRAGQAAVRQAPADPFLNGILASALAERQATLRRISSSADDWY